MERIWQWAWDRFATNYSWATYAVAIAVSLPSYVLWSLLIVALEGSTEYVEAAAVTVAVVPLLGYLNLVPGLGWGRVVDRWAAGREADPARALDATYAWTRGAVARMVGCNGVCVGLLSVVVGAVAGVIGWRLAQYGILGALIGAAMGMSAMHSLGEAAIRPARAAIAGGTAIGDSLPRSRPSFATWSNAFVLATVFVLAVDAAMLAAAFLTRARNLSSSPWSEAR